MTRFPAMNDKLVTGCYSAAPLPQRSRLFALPPVESPPEQREGLISLLIRTSGAHSVNPRRLIARIFGEALPEIEALAYPSFFNRLAGTINGHGKYADLFVEALEALTGQQGLSRLTLLPWKDLFPHNGQGTLAHHPRWCSACLLEQRRRREDIYFPLLWSLDAYRVCTTHQRRLDDCCPHCGKRQPFLPRYPDQAVCHHCLQSLIHSPPINIDSETTDVGQFDNWVAKALENMLAQHDEVTLAPTANQFRIVVQEMVESLANGNRAAFCRAVGFNKHALKNWLTKGERPSITQFLALSYAVQALPSTLFASVGSASATPQVPLVRLPCKLKVRKRGAKVSAQHRADLGKRLQATLQIEPPPPVSMLANDYGVTAQYLRYHFPEMCAQLANRYKEFMRRKSASRSNAQCARVREIVCTLRRANSYPSRRKVDVILRKEGASLGKRDVFSAYQAALVA